MSRVSFFDDFIGQNGLGTLLDHPSFFAPWWDDGGATQNHILDLVSENCASTLRARTSNVAGKKAGIYLPVPMAQAKRHPVFGGTVMFRGSTAIDNQKVWLGLSKPFLPTTSVNDDFHGFFLENGGSPGNWQWIHRSGGSEQTGDTGFTARQEFWYELQIALTPKEAIYIVNGKLVQGIKRDASTFDLHWVVMTETATAAQREMISDFLYGSQDR